MYKPACVRSSTPISEITPVVRNKNINWLESEGYIFISVCGTIIDPKMVLFDRFSAAAASS